MYWPRGEVWINPVYIYIYLIYNYTYYYFQYTYSYDDLWLIQFILTFAMIHVRTIVATLCTYLYGGILGATRETWKVRVHSSTHITNHRWVRTRVIETCREKFTSISDVETVRHVCRNSSRHLQRVFPQNLFCGTFYCCRLTSKTLAESNGCPYRRVVDKIFYFSPTAFKKITLTTLASIVLIYTRYTWVFNLHIKLKNNN